MSVGASPSGRLRRWIVTAAELGLVGAWLMVGTVYIVTPRDMARALAMTDATRESVGLVTAALAIFLLVGVIVRRRPLIAGIGLAALSAAGVLWAAYDLGRHWTPFALFHAALAAIAVGILVFRERPQ